jgi:hypothetical protein
MSKTFLLLRLFFGDEEGNSILLRKYGQKVRNCAMSFMIFCGLQNIKDLFLFLDKELYWEARCLVWCGSIQSGRKFVTVPKGTSVSVVIVRE